MIFVWLFQFGRYIRWLFVPPAIENVARADINERCPIDGFRKNTIRCVRVQDLNAVRKQGDPIPYKLMRHHRCNICGARWLRDPVIKVKYLDVMPSGGRDELEKRDDAYGSMQPNQTAN